jgi:hypothetical protein
MPHLRSLIALLLAAATYYVAGAAPPPGQPPKGGLVVTGRVYCDNCRAGFETNASHNIAGETRRSAIIALNNAIAVCHRH